MSPQPNPNPKLAYKTPKPGGERWCSLEECNNSAWWMIQAEADGLAPHENSTDACHEHLGDLLNYEHARHYVSALYIDEDGKPLPPPSERNAEEPGASIADSTA